MGFLSGQMTFGRYQVEGGPQEFGLEHLETLAKFAIGQIESSSTDGLDVGFIAGQHLFDLNFTADKNLINEFLHFGIRVDTNKVPAPLRQAWLQIELALLAAENPSGRPTKTQKQQAKESVNERCEEEAKSGKFRRMKQFSVLWDARDSMLYLGSTSAAAGEHVAALLNQAFEVELKRLTAGQMAQAWAGPNRKKTALAEINASRFQESQAWREPAWMANQFDTQDYLGNEFLLWLWWYLETQSDTVLLSDGSEVTGMLHKTLSLECPVGETGKDTMSAESPVKLPEARQAIRSGKLPRKCGMILSRFGEQYQFVLQAEAFQINGAKIDTTEPSGKNAREERIETLRHFMETLDLLYGAFCERRIGDEWPEDLDQIANWVQEDVEQTVAK
ncbi:MAG: hypothetical protein JWM11_142 [Planctomycetaceae bacterium]|nr:hypothetical protein [Planctomycetaceae bacterium]